MLLVIRTFLLILMLNYFCSCDLGRMHCEYPNNSAYQYLIDLCIIEYGTDVTFMNVTHKKPIKHLLYH